MTPFRKSVRRVTEDELGHEFGIDKKRRLVVKLGAGDLISLRPLGTRREVSITAADVYHYVLRCEANRSLLDMARARKASKANRLAQQRQERAERQLKIAL